MIFIFVIDIIRYLMAIAKSKNVGKLIRPRRMELNSQWHFSIGAAYRNDIPQYNWNKLWKIAVYID